MRLQNLPRLRRALLGAAILLPWGMSALAGDPVVARSLLDSGRKAVNARKYDEAVSLLARARQEDPALAEASYWIGVACDKQKDDAGSLAAYREFLAALDARGGEASADEKRYRSLAEKRLAILAAGEKDLRKLDERCVAALMDFAASRADRDPGIALQALERLLAVDPDHDGALTLREKLGGAKRPPKDAAAAAGPAIAPVEKWFDFLAERLITSEVISYDGDLMVVDTRKEGKKITPKRSPDVGEAFAFEMEFRVAEVYDSGWLTALSFADDGPSFMAAFVQRSRVVLLQASEKAGNEELAVHEMSAIDPSVYHRLGVVVRGKDLEIWLDGAVVVRYRTPDRPDMKGELGLWQQGCRTERRVFRAGSL